MTIKEYSKAQYCPECGSAMERIYSPPQIKRSSFVPGYHPAFGKEFRNSGEIKEEIRRIRGEDGRDIVEVGNDSMKSIRRPKSSYD